MSHESLEMLLHTRLDVNQSKEQYGSAVEMILTEYPDGTIRKKKLGYKDMLTHKSENLLKT